jgi:hypothetical protein
MLMVGGLDQMPQWAPAHMLQGMLLRINLVG